MSGPSLTALAAAVSRATSPDSGIVALPPVLQGVTVLRGGQVWARVPTLDPQTLIGPLRHAGTALPPTGARCVLLLAEDGDPWLGPVQGWVPS